MRSHFIAVFLLGSTLLAASHAARADIVGSVTLFKAGTHTPLANIDFGKVPVGETAYFDLDVEWDFGYPWGVDYGSSFGMLADPAPPFGDDDSYDNCWAPLGGAYECHSLSATFTPTAAGKVDGFLTAGFFFAYLSNCPGEDKGSLYEDDSAIYCLDSRVISLEEFGTAEIRIPIAGIGVTAVPIPAALPLLASGIGALGAIGWRRRKTNDLTRKTTSCSASADQFSE